jgi:hypothetical protein
MSGAVIGRSLARVPKGYESPGAAPIGPHARRAGTPSFV